MKNMIELGGKKPNIHSSCFVADNAVIIGDAELGEGTNVWFGAVIRADVSTIRIGKNCNIQDNCVMHCSEESPTILGDNVTVGHGAILHGCTVEDGGFIGMGAIVLDGAVVGRGATVGAGAVVTRNTVIPPLTVSVGSPAKVIKELTEDAYSANIRHAERYRDYSEEYK